MDFRTRHILEGPRLEETRMSDDNPRTISNTLRHIGYAAAFVSGSAAAVYTLSSALRRHDLSAIWMLDKRAAPPPEIQRELSGDPYGSDSDTQSDDQTRRKKSLRRLEVNNDQDVYNDELSKLEEKMNHAMRKGDMHRVQELAGRIDDLQRAQQAVSRQKRSWADRRDHRAHDSSRDRYTVNPPQDRTPNANRVTPQSGRSILDDRGIDSSYGSRLFEGLRRSVPSESPQSRRGYDGSHVTYACSSAEEELRPCREDLSSTTCPPYEELQVGGSRVKTRHFEQRESVHQGANMTDRSEVALADAKLPANELSRALPRKRPADNSISASALEAEPKFKPGDLVKAECPLTHEWHDATVRAVRGRGLVEVRWHNPGTDEHGKAFSRYGDVYADKLRFAFRKDITPPINPTTTLPLTTREPQQRTQQTGVSNDDSEMLNGTTSHGLQVGDECYARGRIVEPTWFKARVLALRAKSPPIRVEYLETFDGEKGSLLLPEPRKAFVNETDVRREKPQDAVVRNEASVPHATETPHVPTQTQGPCESDHLEGIGDAIDEDLMCSVCARPDDEANMLICDCKKGFHIYCLTPKLSSIPSGDWFCPDCSAKGSE